MPRPPPRNRNNTNKDSGLWTVGRPRSPPLFPVVANSVTHVEVSNDNNDEAKGDEDNNDLAGNVGDMSATRRNVANFRADRGNLATWIPVCRHTFVSRFPDIDGPRTDDI